MITKENILKVVEEYAGDNGLFVVEVMVKKDNRVTVYVDSINGLQLDDCVKLTRYIESKFDREEEDYSLEVSSPGLDYPLHLQMQFQKNLNRELILQLDNGGSLTGKLKAHSKESLDIEYEKITTEGKKKRKEIVIEKIPLASVKQAKIKVVFK
jgi:ribosome maturation factor RimP